MRIILFTIVVLFSIGCFAQKKDSTKVDSSALKAQIMQQEVDAINYVVGDIKKLTYGKVDPVAYENFLKVVDRYIEEKQKQFETKKPKK